MYAYDALVPNSYFLGKFKEHIQGTQRLIEVAIEADHKWELAFALYAAESWRFAC